MIALLVLVTSLGAALGVLYPFISVILASFGFTAGEIGLIFAVGAIGFTAAVPAWGHLADVRLGRTGTLALCAIGAGGAIAVLVLPVPPLVIVGLLLAFWVFESSWQPLGDAITVNAVGGRRYARIRLFTSLGFSVAVIAAGFLYDAVGFTPAFVLFALGAAILALSTWFVPDVERADLAAHRRQVTTPPTDVGTTLPATAPAPTSSGRGWSWRLVPGSAGVAFRVAPRLAAVLVAVTTIHIGIISGFTFLPLRIEELGGSPADVALSAGLSAAVEVPGMLVMGIVARAIGLRAIFVASTLLYAACIASWMVIEIPLVIVATRALTGLSFSGIIVGVVLTIAAILPRDLQGTGQSLFQTFAFGIGAIIANMLGGLLYASSGHAALFGVGAVLAVAAAGIGWLAFPSRAEGRLAPAAPPGAA